MTGLAASTIVWHVPVFARLVLCLAVTVCTGAVGGCASAGTSVGSTARVAPPAVLPVAAVPYLPSTTSALSAARIAHEAELPTLVSRLRSWGFDAAAIRYFQGESRRRLQVVDSRSFRFATPVGAQSFVRFIQDHPTAFLPDSEPPHAYSSRGRSGVVMQGALCACHLSMPVYLAVVSRATRVTWLEVNGPGATPRALRRLIAKAP